MYEMLISGEAFLQIDDLFIRDHSFKNYETEKKTEIIRVHYLKKSGGIRTNCDLPEILVFKNNR